MDMQPTKATATCECGCSGDQTTHNLNHLNACFDYVASGNTATCPKCHKPANPQLVEHWGHCVTCQNQRWAEHAASLGY